MSIDAGDRWVEAQINERDRVGRYMYDHQSDYISRSKYENTVNKLNKAKDLLTRFVWASAYLNGRESDLVEEVKQFLKEIAD